jgi:hypothetical protein
MRGRISRTNRQVCDLLHGGPTAERRAVFVAVHMSLTGPKRHFAATQHLVAFASKADIDRRNVVARIATRIALALRVRGRGHLEPNDFPVLGNSFPVFSPKIRCSIAQGNSAKESGIPRQLSAADAATALVSRISLYFSLLAGNLGRRLVRTGLPRQAGSPVRTCPTSVGTAAARAHMVRATNNKSIQTRTRRSKQGSAAKQLIRKVVFPYQCVCSFWVRFWVPVPILGGAS